MVFSYSEYAQVAEFLVCFNSLKIIQIIPCKKMHTQLENDFPCP